MRSFALAAALVLLASAAHAAPSQDAAAAPSTALPDKFKDQKAQQSYAIGVNLGSQLRQQPFAIDPQILEEGVADALAGRPTQMTDAQIQAVLAKLQTVVRAEREQAAAAAAAANKAQGEAFLAANKAKPGVVTLPSGLQYQVLTAGSGAKPSLLDTVICNYRGTLVDGTEFDSSYKRGAPVSLPVSGVIPGWREALQIMPAGSKWRLFVPAALAYGEEGSGPVIGPDAVLIFDIELLSVEARD
jgi:FKBP-type peptidyl-prolyl cis-trans isomerase FklB